MPASSWEMGFHLRPQHGWLNDPNGLCHFRDRYHFFYQFDPEWPVNRDQKWWGHFTSTDLLHWVDEGIAISPDTCWDKDGAFSGSALVMHGAASDGGDLLRLYYTGNVNEPGFAPGDPNRVDCGFWANELMVESEDGLSFGGKSVLLRDRDYPDESTRHVRDPKVWEQDGAVHMLLGSRDKGGAGFLLIYDSEDGVEWRLRSTVRSLHNFGYMWECPNIAQVGGREFLCVSPQGLPNQEERWQNMWQAGYFPLEGKLLETREVDETTFHEWDHGFDFYAPQIFTDDSDRTVLVGWMGTFDESYTSEPEGLEYVHCLTVPRELLLSASGRLLQRPVGELEQLRGKAIGLELGAPVQLDMCRADIVIRNVLSRRAGSITLNNDIMLTFGAGRMTVTFLCEQVAAGRSNRYVPFDVLHSLRILVDGSTIEVYANGGETVFSTRWFPTAETLTVESGIDAANSVVYPMDSTEVVRREALG
ncbi:glycoside hydrolase family 32 protein [Olsenella sp. HMSC062G07]|uniref:glycoside hydrolase family 32 protein n=1 Tax=Olsenella sp. HMSC062G07 TaxID=1739330 RepID=UPI0008A23162|nr:glycoside hydrolase family 32 protein [Olsenella sp. HMSC062G07]OFK22693.1 hypothetical protein HMPREF2826_01120 [Olsenella sp. HMSC062G07]